MLKEDVTLQKFQFYFVASFILISIRFWSFKLIPDAVFDALEFAFLSSIVLITLNNYSRLKKDKMYFSVNVNLFIWLPVVSVFAAWAFHDQQFYLSSLILRNNFFWLFYFVLHIFNVPPKKLINLILLVGAVWIVLTVVQQFTYPNYVFYTRNEEKGISIFRAGVYRFMVEGHHYAMFFCFYFFFKYLITKRLPFLFIVILGLVGFYYFGTRQTGISVVVCLVIASLMQKGSAKVLSVFTLLVIFSVLYLYKDVLFGSYIDMTKDQVSSEDDVRLLATNFFLFEYWPHWSTFFIGNGMEHSYSSYGKEIISLQENFGFHRVDVGIIGVLNSLGLLYVANIFWTNIRALKDKLYMPNHKYLKLIFYSALMLILFSVFYTIPTAIPFFCIVFYLIDKSYSFNQMSTSRDKSNIK